MQFPISIQRLKMNMKIWKILFITILYLQSKAQAEVAPNLEPFLSLKVGSVFISNGDYYWKEFQNSTNAIYAYYQSFDLHSSLFYPKVFQHKVHGKVAFFECGGGYPNTAIQVYGRGYLYCGNFNGTPTDEQLFHTFDETSGRISMQAVTFPGKFLTMWHYYPCVGYDNSCENDDCRFTLEDPTNSPPTIEVLKVTFDAKRIESNEKGLVVLGNGTAVSDGVEGHNSTISFSSIQKITHTTNWSYKFATIDWKFKNEEKDYKFEKETCFDKVWFNEPNCLIIGLDATKIGRSYTTTRNFKLTKTVTLMVEPGYLDELIWQIKVYDVKIPITARIRRTEFDILNKRFIHSNLTVHGSWTGQVIKYLPDVCQSKPIVPPGQSNGILSREIQKPNSHQAKKCRILRDITI